MHISFVTHPESDVEMSKSRNGAIDNTYDLFGLDQGLRVYLECDIVILPLFNSCESVSSIFSKWIVDVKYSCAEPFTILCNDGI